MSSEQFFNIDNRIEVRNSALHGKGVFVKSNEKVEAFRLLTYYAGTREQFSHKSQLLSPAPTSRKYTIRCGKILWNADILVRSSQKDNALAPTPFAHLINSSHPNMMYPNSSPNCKFFPVKVISEDKRKNPSIRVGVMSTKTLSENEELLVDYHWNLSYVTFSNDNQLLECGCRLCLPNLLVYYKDEAKKVKKFHERKFKKARRIAY